MAALKEAFYKHVLCQCRVIHAAICAGFASGTSGLFTAGSLLYTRAPMPRYSLQLHDGSERTIQADRLELAPPIQICRFHSGDAAEDFALAAIRALVLLDPVPEADDAPHGGLEIHADTSGALEISQPNPLQPGTTAAVFVPTAEVEWLVGELRRVRSELPGARRQRSARVRRDAAGSGKKKQTPAAERERPSSRAKRPTARRRAK